MTVITIAMLNVSFNVINSLEWLILYCMLV